MMYCTLRPGQGDALHQARLAISKSHRLPALPVRVRSYSSIRRNGSACLPCANNYFGPDAFIRFYFRKLKARQEKALHSSCVCVFVFLYSVCFVSRRYRKAACVVSYRIVSYLSAALRFPWLLPWLGHEDLVVVLGCIPGSFFFRLE